MSSVAETSLSVGANQGDLADIMSAFNTVTERLQSAHSALQLEVARLKRELRDTNEQLQRSRRLAALGQMAAGIAHEIRNPLASIRLYASMLTEDLAGQTGPVDVARKIDRAGRDMDAIVSDVLAFAREIRLRPNVVTPVDLFETALEQCSTLWQNTAISVLRQYEDDPTDSALALEVDSALINQVLTNLIRNAAEAMSSDGGSLILDVQTREIDAEDDHAGEWIILSIQDQGPGINEEVLDRVFNPFFTTRSCGTGLGLAIAHRIVDAHHGMIQIQNAPERGAIASVHLRRQLPATAQIPASSPDPVDESVSTLERIEVKECTS